MSDPIAFPSSTPVLRLPLLIAGQAQKEFFVNQALCLLDALHTRSISESRPGPPAAPVEGTGFRVTAPAAADWTGEEDSLAVRIGGAWHFIRPPEGMVIYDQAAGHQLVFRSTWMRAAAPDVPTGGLIIDTEARQAIDALIQALLAVGVLGSANI